MDIIIKRTHTTAGAIDGILSVDGTRVCDTEENAAAALAEGTYPVAVCKCRQHARKMPLVLARNGSLPDCRRCKRQGSVYNNTAMPVVCRQLCPGNGVAHRTDGAIVLGERVAPGCLAHPKQAFDTLYGRIRKAVERGNGVTLSVREWGVNNEE